MNKKNNNFPSQEELERVREKFSDPSYQGGSFVLPEDANSLARTKYEICQSILRYKRERELSREEIAQRIELSKAETEELLFCNIENFTLDRLVSYLERLHMPLQVRVMHEENKNYAKQR